MEMDDGVRDWGVELRAEQQRFGGGSGSPWLREEKHRGVTLVPRWLGVRSQIQIQIQIRKRDSSLLPKITWIQCTFYVTTYHVIKARAQ